MTKILVVVNHSTDAQKVVKKISDIEDAEVHLLYIRKPFSTHIAQFASKQIRTEYHKEKAYRVLKPVKDVLDKLNIPCTAYIGNNVKSIKILNDYKLIEE